MEKKRKELTTRAYAYQFIYTGGVVGEKVTYNFLEAFNELNNSQGKIEGLLATKVIFRSNGTFANKGKRYLMRGQEIKSNALDKNKVKLLFENDTVEEYIVTSSGVAVPKTERVKLLAPFYVSDSRK